MNIWIIFTFNIIYFLIVYCVSSYYTQFEERKKNTYYMKNISINFILSIILVLPVLYYSNLLLSIPSLKNIIITFLAQDTLVYFFHYITHCIPFVMKYIHHTHHTYTKLVPLDNLFLDSLDHILYSLIYLYIPLFFTENIVEYLICLIITLFHTFYIHSNVSEKFFLPFFIDAKYHSLHHTYGYGNFSTFFPFWDDYMNTRVKEIPKTDTDNKTMTIDKFNEECKKGSQLTIINGNIIDCKMWINTHPGGSSIIKSLIGKDSSKEFNKIHGTSKPAMEMLTKLKIAEFSK